jgi:hypothetical protein
VDVLGPFEIIKRPLTIGNGPVAAGQPPDKSGPLIWWKLDDGKGAVVANAAGTKLGGTVHGEARWTPGIGATRSALEFDGARNWVEAADSEDLDFQAGLTLATWFKVRKFRETGDSLLAKGESWRLQHQGDKGKLEFFMQGPKKAKGATSASYVNVATKREVNDGEWHHVIVTYDGKKAVLYLDGAEEGSIDATGCISANNLPVTLGENYSLPGRWFDGWVGETRIYPRGLTADEVKELSSKL